MTIDRIEAKCGEGSKNLTLNDHVNAEAYSDSSMRVFQKCGVGKREEAASNNLDFNTNRIYGEDKNESNEGARPTPLAAQQRLERLAANKDVQQTQGEKVANPASKPSDFQSPRVEGKDNETSEAERVTPLARAQRDQRLANNPNLKSW